MRHGCWIILIYKMLITLILPSFFVHEVLRAYLWGLCEAWPAHSSTSGPRGWPLCHCATAGEGKHSAHYCCLKKQETDSQGAILKKRFWYPFGFSCCCIANLWRVFYTNPVFAFFLKLFLKLADLFLEAVDLFRELRRRELLTFVLARA